MKKVAIFLLTAAIAGVCLTACGTEENGSAVDSSVYAETSSNVQEDMPHVELKGSGVAWDDGETYFAIDSMQMTEEGLVIQYRGKWEPAGANQTGDFEVQPTSFTLNGKKPERFYSRDKDGSSVSQAGGERVCEFVVEAEELKTMGITEVPVWEAELRLGSSEEFSEMHEVVRFRLTVTP